MSAHFVLNATIRGKTGTQAARVLRRQQDALPAVIYGGDKPAQAITLNHKEIIKASEHEGFFSHIITINVGSQSEQVIVKELLRHNTKPKIMHADFQRIKTDEKIVVKVPLHFVGEENCPGVKAGGLVSHILTELEISCLPANLPEYVEVDVAALDINQAIRLRDIQLPANVQLAQDISDETHNLEVISIHHAKVVEDAAPAEQAETEAEQSDS